MTVRASILSVLTLGPAYGLQLHAEVEQRSARAGAINVGQIYSTLTRLVTAGLVVSSDVTDDGLPLYRLTEEGRLEALSWLQTASIDADDAFMAMVRHVLLASTLSAPDARLLIARYTEAWRSRSPLAGAGDPLLDAARIAADLEAEAALRWLAQVGGLVESSALSPVTLTAIRPKRGRRPVQPA